VRVALARAQHWQGARARVCCAGAWPASRMRTRPASRMPAPTRHPARPPRQHTQCTASVHGAGCRGRAAPPPAVARTGCGEWSGFRRARATQPGGRRRSMQTPQGGAGGRHAGGAGAVHRIRWSQRSSARAAERSRCRGLLTAPAPWMDAWVPGVPFVLDLAHEHRKKAAVVKLLYLQGCPKNSAGLPNFRRRRLAAAVAGRAQTVRREHRSSPSADIAPARGDTKIARGVRARQGVRMHA